MKLTTSLIALSVIGTFALAVPLSAATKGGEALNAMNARKARAEARTSTVAQMACPVEVRTTVDKSARGAFKPVSIYTAHACPSCATKEVRKGAGKLARQQLEHTCKTAALCCK